MGVDYTAYYLYGIEFCFNDLEHVKNMHEFKKLAKFIDTVDLRYLFSGYFSGELITIESDNCHENENTNLYYIGKVIDLDDLKNNNLKLYKNKIKELCVWLNVKYTEPELHRFVKKW